VHCSVSAAGLRPRGVQGMEAFISALKLILLSYFGLIPYQGCLNFKKGKERSVTLAWAFQSSGLMSLGFTALPSKLRFCISDCFKNIFSML